MERPAVLAFCLMAVGCRGEARKQPTDNAPTASDTTSTAPPAVADPAPLVATSGATDPLVRPTPKVLAVAMEEAVLARMPATDFEQVYVLFRPDGRKVAVLGDGRKSLHVNGDPVTGYELFTEHRWLTDGRLQFVGERGDPSAGGGVYVVTEGEVLGPYAHALAVGRYGSDAVLVQPQRGQHALLEGATLGPSFDNIHVLDLVYNDVHALVAYVGTRGKAEGCVVARSGTACFPGVGRPVLSADESTLAFVVWDRDVNKARLVVGGKRGPAFDGINELTLSRKGSVWAYVAKQDDKERVVVGDAQGERFDHVGDLQLSANGAAVAYYARNGNDAYLMAGGQRISLPGTGTGDLGFGTLNGLELSPDGRHFIGVTSLPRGGKHYAIVDGTAGPHFDRVMFSRMSFDGVAAYVTVDGRQQRMMIGETLGEPYDTVLPVEFGPTAGSFAYIAISGADQFVVTQRGVLGPYRDIGDPDRPPSYQVGKLYIGAHGEVVYRARTDEGWHLVVDGKLGPAFDQVFEPPTFTRTAIGYGVRAGDELRWAVLATP